MAIKKLKLRANGQISGEYWKITSLSVDFVEREMTFMLQLFKNKSFADDKAEPLDRLKYTAGILPGVDPISVNPKMTELVALAYSVAKTKEEFLESEDV